MYVAALRLADEFGCSTIGIQYQQGLKDLAAGQRPGGRAAEQRRSPAGKSREDRSRVLFDGEALPHFNEVDECAGWMAW